MTKRYTRSSAKTAKHMADRLDNRDEDVMQGLVTAGAFVALAESSRSCLATARPWGQYRLHYQIMGRVLALPC